MRIRCPYCGNAMLLLSPAAGYQLITCDIEDSPGCDRTFAIDVEIIKRAKIFTLTEKQEATNGQD